MPYGMNILYIWYILYLYYTSSGVYLQRWFYLLVVYLPGVLHRSGHQSNTNVLYSWVVYSLLGAGHSQRAWDDGRRPGRPLRCSPDRRSPAGRVWAGAGSWGGRPAGAQGRGHGATDQYRSVLVKIPPEPIAQQTLASDQTSYMRCATDKRQEAWTYRRAADLMIG